MRTGRLMNNQDAFEVDYGQPADGGNGRRIISPSKVAELCGHEEGDAEELLASFGLTSISVAELGRIHPQTEYNYQVSALELDDYCLLACRWRRAIVLGRGG